MKVINIHKRTFSQSKKDITELIDSLATQNDKIWPFEKWPKIKFKEGIKEGAIGGHGPIRYKITKHLPGELILFEFIKPKGFNGIQKFEINDIAENEVELKHTIDMNTSGVGTLSWIFGIRSLHDALFEDLFDKIDNHLNDGNKITDWSLWVKFLRKLLS